MSVPVLLSITIGLPIVLLALGIFYHGYVIARQSLIDPLDAHVAGLASGQADAMVADLQRSMGQIRDQLAQQRDALSGMLSEGERAPRGYTRSAAPMFAGADLSAAAPAARDTIRERARETIREARVSGAPRPPSVPAQADAPLDPTTDLRGSVARLAAEGLSDRAIARQLHIGLEEVRMSRTRTGNAS